MTSGSLTIVGSGICADEHMTLRALGEVRSAGRVLYTVADPFTEAYIRELAPEAQNLVAHYSPAVRRSSIYEAIAQQVAAIVKSGERTCFVAYGHPAVAADATRRALDLVGGAGLPATMLPGISAEACLYADLGIDPVRTGMQSYEATQFVQDEPVIETRAGLIIWQIGCVGNRGWPASRDEGAWLKLCQRLRELFGEAHSVVLYEAATFALASPRILRITVANLLGVPTGLTTSLYVPPRGAPAPTHT